MAGTIRRAGVADLTQIYDIWYEAEIEDDPDPPPPGSLCLLEHELESAEMYCFERAGQVLGFATLLRRGTVTYLADFYVRRAQRSSGIGQALLRQVQPQDGSTFCTLSSADPRAQALYIRAGMHPRWPHFLLHLETAHLGELPSHDVVVLEGQAGDPDLLRWDGEIGGRYRPQEHAYWVGRLGAIPLWFQRQGQVVGYGYAQMHSPEALWHPQAVTLGPIGTRTVGDALGCTCAAVGWAALRASIVRLGLPGPHPALAALLRAHLHITYVETFFSSADEPFAEPNRYIPSGSTLY